MDERRARGDRRGHQSIDIQVTLGRRTRADVTGLVGDSNVQRLTIAVGVDRDGAQAHLPARADDADGNLSAVRDEEFHEAGVDLQRDVAVLARRVPVALVIRAREGGNEL